MASVAFNPNFTPSAGLNCVLASSASGTPAYAGTGWTININAKQKDVSNFVTGRLKVPTLLDGSLDTTIVWDTNTPPITGGSSPVGLYVGAYVTLYAFTDLQNLKYFTFKGLIADIKPAIAGIEDAMLIPITIELSATPPSVTFTQLPQFVYPT